MMEPSAFRLNLGCGFNKKDGYVNVDKFDTCKPDLTADLERTPWPFADSSVDEILFNHSLEHMGQQTDVFLSIIKEMYRICKGGARIQINVPHPRHDHFIGDPTHVRPITPEVLGLFSKKNCQEWIRIGAANSPLALYLDVDFEVVSVQVTPDPQYRKLLDANGIDFSGFLEASKSRNNVATEYRITIQVVK